MARLAQHHGLLGLVRPALARHTSDVKLLALLRETEASDAAWRGHLLDALDQVTTALAGVRHVVLKGPPLAARLYSPPHARISLDLDLLIANVDRDAVRERLERLGYKKLVHPNVRAHIDDPYVHDELPPVEVHFAAHRGFGAKLESGPFLDRSVAFENVRILGAEDEVPYLAAHAASHRFDRLVWVHDIAMLAQRDPDRVPVWRNRARELSVLAATDCALALAASCFGVGDATSRRLGPLRQIERLPPVFANTAVWMMMADSPGNAARVVLDKLKHDLIPRLAQTWGSW